jgi:hypothetical protein
VNLVVVKFDSQTLAGRGHFGIHDQGPLPTAAYYPWYGGYYGYPDYAYHGYYPGYYGYGWGGYYRPWWRHRYYGGHYGGWHGRGWGGGHGWHGGGHWHH